MTHKRVANETSSDMYSINTSGTMPTPLYCINGDSICSEPAFYSLGLILEASSLISMYILSISALYFLAVWGLLSFRLPKELVSFLRGIIKVCLFGGLT